MIGIDFATLPPEVNSGLMYSGSGAGPILSAATAWDSLASELSSAASAYRELVSELTEGPWRGPTATAMATAAAPYIDWMARTADQAAETASQAKSAAAAYETAFTATVPPPVITANRALLMMLVATNFFGQNTPAIAANQAEYAEMWAQDATAMYSYAGSAAAATQLQPFSVAPPSTNPAGIASSAAEVAGSASGFEGAPAWATSLLNFLSSLGTSGPAGWFVDLVHNGYFQELAALVRSTEGFVLAEAGVGFNAVSTVFIVAPGVMTAETQGIFATRAYAGSAAGGLLGAEMAVAPEPPVPIALSTSVSAGVGRATSVGALSVPQAWTGAAQVELTAASIPASLAAPKGAEVAEPAMPGMRGLGGTPPPISMVDTTRNDGSRSRYAERSKLIEANPGKAGPGGQPAAESPDGGQVATRELTERELLERDELVEQIEELARHRDAVTRLIKEAIRS